MELLDNALQFKQDLGLFFYVAPFLKQAKAIAWAGYLVPIPFILALAVWAAGTPALWLSLLIVAGLLIFGYVFAVNSSVHSYLILAFSKADRVSQDVGFYYMANAAGRLLGTMLSGVSYQIGGLPLCLGSAGAMALLNWLAVQRLAQPPA